MARKPVQSERVYNELRERLTRGELVFGSRLTEQQLASEFEMSRTPVREALRRLEGDGHLSRDAAGALRPRVPSLRSMRDLYDVRLALEDLIVRRCTSTGDRGLLEALQQDWMALQSARGTGPSHEGTAFVHRDEAFHECVAEASGNHVATHYLRDINARIRVLRIHDFAREHRVEQTIAEHLEILRAILDGDPDEAASFMRGHVQRSARQVREQIGEILSRMVDPG